MITFDYAPASTNVARLQMVGNAAVHPLTKAKCSEGIAPVLQRSICLNMLWPYSNIKTVGSVERLWSAVTDSLSLLRSYSGVINIYSHN